MELRYRNRLFFAQDAVLGYKKVIVLVSAVTTWGRDRMFYVDGVEKAREKQKSLVYH